ncbi:MAG TPA: cell envelope integrity protein TolA [Thiobacillus sp.]|nr:cell envelope integrity protein TolA [Thiobacillus sp.]
MIAATDAPHFSRPGPNLAAGVLALGVHVAFLLLLVVGVSWQTDHPAPVMVDLWEALPVSPTPPVVEPEPQPEPVPPPPPEPVKSVEPPPPAPPVVPRPAPAPEPLPAPRAADIALEKKKAETARLEKLKALQAAEEKALADAAQAEVEAMKRARDQQLAEQKRRELLRQMEEDELMMRMAEESAASELRQAREAEARLVASRRQAEITRAVGQYRDKISATVRGNTRLPADLKGNPEVRFLVRLLPTGEVTDIRRTQSSGNPAYDEAVERAIRKSSPLPLPADREARAAFVPELSFVHRPKE